MNNPQKAHPPKPPLVLRIGVTGHRPEPANIPEEKRKRPLPDIPAIQKTVFSVLEVIRNTFKGIADTSGHLFDLTTNPSSQQGGGVLRIVSALASGADQWVAQIATLPDLNFELQCILPFQQDEYINDFSDLSEKELFNKLLNQASSVLELDGKVIRDEAGNRKPDNHSYEAVGRALLNQTDILIAVWDGKEANGKGGTGQVVKEALMNGIPVIWVPWSAPGKWSLQAAKWQLLEELSDMEDDVDHLSEIIEELLLPPKEIPVSGLESGKSLRSAYFSETRKKGNVQHGIWLLFRNIICGEIFTKKGMKDAFRYFRVDDFESDEAKKSEKFWKFDAEGKPYRNPLISMQNWVDERYTRHYAWANGLSVYYGNMHRSAFMLNYLLGAMAVFLALICVATGVSGTLQTGWIIAELIVIIGILALTFRGRLKQWHQRWIDYRTLAEYLRLSRCLILMGGGTSQVVYGGHLRSYGNPAHTWMNWHYKAIERAAGIPNVCFTGDYLGSCQDLFRDGLVEGQVRYHKSTFRRFEKMDKRLHKMGDWLFIATLAACALHLVHIWVEEDLRFNWIPDHLSTWMTLLCAFLPALGAAFAAIRSHGELQRLAQRSKAMEENLTELQSELAKIPVTGEMLNSVKLRYHFDRVSNLMTSEMLDWRVVFQDRPLGLPT
jgi:hypothetical protein